MEQLREIILLEYRGLFSVNLFQALEIGFLTLLMLGIYRLLLKKVFPWYFGKETTSNKNRERTLRVTRLLLFSFFIVVVLRVFNLDYKLIDESLYTIEELKRFEMENPDAANDNPLRFIIRISTIIKAFLVFVVANVLDLVLGEVLTQRFQRRQSKAKKAGTAIAATSGLPDRIKWLKPVLYMLAIIVIVNDTGLAPYKLFDLPTGLDHKIPFSVGRLAYTVFLFMVISLAINFFISFLLRGYYLRSKIDTGSQFAINRLFTYFAYLIGILLVIQAAGFNLVAIWTGAAALLVGIGIGLQQTFNDLICGIIILFERSVKVGDVVELVGHQVGTVRRIGARTSIVETRDDIIIFVPNSKLIGENVVNWSTINRTARFNVTISVAYGSDTSLVKEILEQAAGEHPRILDTPQPFVRFVEFGDSSLNFEVLFWSRDFIRVENIKSDLRFAIDAAFRAKGIEIPFPQRDLWIRGGLPGTEQETPPAEE
jgi:small-conductance mechanosensitive channel